MDKLIESLITSGVPAVVILFGLYLGKNLMEHFFNETIEIKKKELEQESKNFQHQLDSKLQEFNIKFSNLHTERANVIKELYEKLINLDKSIKQFIDISQDIDKSNPKRLRVNKSLVDFANYYYPNKIYFSKSISSKIEILFKEYRKTGIKFDRLLSYMTNPDKEYNEKYDNTWDEIYEKTNTYFPPLFEELEDEFREILGVKN
ncbi:TPA: hypothetical protein ACGGHC_000444 [Flavobacterium psychrophilum]